MQFTPKTSIDIPIVPGFRPDTIHGLYMAAEQVPRCQEWEVQLLDHIYRSTGMFAMEGLAMGWDVAPINQLRELCRHGARYSQHDRIGPMIDVRGELLGGIAIYSNIEGFESDGLADVIPFDALYLNRRKKHDNTRRVQR